MFFRGRQPETTVWRRFRSGLDGFTFLKEENHYSAHVVANAERVVDLFHALIEDLRTDRKWQGHDVALPDVRDVMARLKVPLASHGGVEFSVYSSEDQLTLNQHLELFVYARTDQWLYLLEGKGLQQARTVRTKSWKLKRGEFPPAPELAEALDLAVERLGLRVA